MASPRMMQTENLRGVLGDSQKLNTDIDEVAGGRSTAGEYTNNSHRSNSKEN